MKKRTNIIIGVLAFILFTIMFFSYNPVIAYDSAHYLWLTDLLKLDGSFSSWDIARGIGFPLIIFITNLLFGNTAISLVITMYIFYIIMCIVSYLIYKEFISTNKKLKKWHKGIIIAGFIILVALNPIIFGFYHTLLTEFLTMSVAIAMCYASWKWTKINFFNNKKKYIIYTIIFALLSSYMYQVKQPYVGAVIFPIIIAMIISIIKEANLKNILQRVITLITCFIAIAISIVVWNSVLIWQNVNMNYERSSSGFLSMTIVDGISNYRTSKDVSLERIENDKMISQEEKEELKKIINEQHPKYKGFVLLEEKNYSSDVIGETIIYTKDSTLSVAEAVKFWFKTLFTKPTIILKSYYKNYFVMCDLYEYNPEQDIIIKYDTIDWLYTSELEPIPYRIYEKDQDAIMPGIQRYEQYISKYRTENKQLPLVNGYMQKMTTVSTLLYKFQCLLIPLFTIVIIIRFLKYRKKYDEHALKCVEIATILYGFSLIHLISHIVLRATIDRYAAPAILTSMIAFMIDLYVVIYNKKSDGKRKEQVTKNGENKGKSNSTNI